MIKEFTHVVEDLPKVKSKLEKESVKQQQRATHTSITSFFWDVLGKIFLLCIRTLIFSLVQLSNFAIHFKT